jgi:cyclopropane fatty-acyl-phospholipid synthase-like methyltransferase
MKVMVKFIKPNSSVLDIGCGQQHLKLYLPENCDYFGCDLYQRFKNTFIWNINKDVCPISVHYFDYIVCSGIIEYIRDVPKFFKTIYDKANNFIVSYAINPSNINIRLKNDWINHYQECELLKLFSENNYQIQDWCKWKNQEIFYLTKGNL